MRKISSILLLTLCVSMTAQYTPRHKQTAWEKWSRPVGIVLYHVSTVALGSIGDAMMDEGNKNLGHALQAGEISALLAGPFIFDIKRNEWLSYVATYGFLRFSLFDSFYAKSRSLPLLFNGTTSSYDRFMNTIPPDGRAWIKSWSLIVGVSIPLNKL